MATKAQPGWRVLSQWLKKHEENSSRISNSDNNKKKKNLCGVTLQRAEKHRTEVSDGREQRHGGGRVLLAWGVMVHMSNYRHG